MNPLRLVLDCTPAFEAQSKVFLIMLDQDYTMQKTFILWCLVLLGTSVVVGQNDYRPTYPLEIGIQVGTAHYLGDLGGVGKPGYSNDSPVFQRGLGQGFVIDTDFKSTRPTIGLFARWNFSGNFSARLDLSYLQLSGSDKYAGKDNFSATQRPIGSVPNAAWFRYYRNLSFRTHMFDANLAFEAIPYNFQLGSGRGSSVLSPYIFVGIGLFTFNPEGFYNGRWVALQPLSTEGQGLVSGRATYDLVQMNIPMGVGLKWIYDDTWSLGLEANYRIIFTDYLDDVSTSYVEDESIFDTNFDPTKAALAKALARRSTEIDPSGINSIVTAPKAKRGNPHKNDAYFTVTIRFSYYIDTYSFGKGGRRYGGCPVW